MFRQRLLPSAVQILKDNADINGNFKFRSMFQQRLLPSPVQILTEDANMKTSVC